MKAFLSHSSKDKDIVEKVFNLLGAANAVYDKETFEEGKRSAEEIVRGLAASDVFVLFLSQHSLGSDYVQNEIAFALEKQFSGRIKGVLVFALDETTHRELPEGLRFYTVERTNRPPQIARRIRSRLIELQLEAGMSVDIFIGRQQELQELERALALPADEMRPVISVAGWQGIGRRTFARRCVQNVFPYLKRDQPVVAVSEGDSIEDFYRKLYDSAYGTPRTGEAWIELAEGFQRLPHSERIAALVQIAKDLMDAKEILYIVGDGGVIGDKGDYQPYLKELIRAVPRGPRPGIVLIQRRRLSTSKQMQYSQVHFASLSSLTDDEAAGLLSAHLKQRDIPFVRGDLEDLVSFVGGHPENIRIAAEYARQYGLPQLRKEKGEFTDVLVFRSLEILKRIDVSPVAQSICAALLDFQYLEIDDFVASIEASDQDIFAQLRHLEDHGILERVSKYYRISPYLVEAIARGDFPSRLAAERKAVGQRILRTLEEASDLDNVSLSLINAGALAAIRAGKFRGPDVVARFVLPSHLLAIAREEYDRQNYRNTEKLCREALRNRERLTLEAQVEAHRLLAISLLRLGRRADFASTLSALQKYQGRAAKRNYYFLLGFQERLDGRIDDAESHYRVAYNIDARNFHVLRELAHVLSMQGRDEEAERFARAAYAIAPTNAFIIDILCSVLIGKLGPEELRHNDELPRLLHELEELGTEQGRSFYEERMALLCYKTGDQEGAWRHADNAVAKSPRHFGPRAARLRLAGYLGRIDKMEEDIRALERLGGGADGNSVRFLVDRARILVAIFRKDVVNAKSLLERARSLPRHTRDELTRELERIAPGERGRRRRRSR